MHNHEINNIPEVIAQWHISKPRSSAVRRCTCRSRCGRPLSIRTAAATPAMAPGLGTVTAAAHTTTGRHRLVSFTVPCRLIPRSTTRMTCNSKSSSEASESRRTGPRLQILESVLISGYFFITFFSLKKWLWTPVLQWPIYPWYRLHQKSRILFMNFHGLCLK